MAIISESRKLLHLKILTAIMQAEARESKAWRYFPQALAALPIGWMLLLYALWLRAYVELGRAPVPMRDDPKGFDILLHHSLLFLPLQMWMESLNRTDRALKHIGLGLDSFTQFFNSLHPNPVAFFPMIATSIVAAIVLALSMRTSKRKFWLAFEIVLLLAIPVLILTDPGKVIVWLLD